MECTSNGSESNLEGGLVRGGRSINVRYLRELRDDIESLSRVLIPTPEGAQVPISLVADLKYTQGPPMIRDEDGQLVGYVFVDVTHEDYEGYVRQAQQIVQEEVDLPPGYRLEWTGQYTYLLRMEERLTYIVPLTLFIIFVLLYMNFGSWKEPFIVMLAVPFSLVGSFWLLYLLDYNLSVAVWVGIIALAGLDAETGAIMLLYLLLAHRQWEAEGKMRNLEDLKEAIHYGSVKRVRPKVMMVLTTTVGLLPIMWASSYETGADVLKWWEDCSRPSSWSSPSIRPSSCCGKVMASEAGDPWWVVGASPHWSQKDSTQHQCPIRT